jgi:hypothetical protein
MLAAQMQKSADKEAAAIPVMAAMANDPRASTYTN